MIGQGFGTVAENTVTPPKRWPTNAEWARQDCISLARAGCKNLLETVDSINNPDALRDVAKTINDLREIEAKLINVGPKGNENNEND